MNLIHLGTINEQECSHSSKNIQIHVSKIYSDSKTKRMLGFQSKKVWKSQTSLFQSKWMDAAASLLKSKKCNTFNSSITTLVLFL